jgi:polysaccharide biosynthesis/export protein
MASGSPGILQRDLNSLFESGSLTGLTDRDLVERVTGQPDAAAEAAFEALVARHGPMVLRVCRNVLGHLEDAEDAFQATFLVLVKQRGSIRKLDSVASWLYGVAARVAARARVNAARRRKSEQSGIRLVADSVATDNTADALDQAVHGPIVQEEVRRLPEKYRSVVLLCYWEGLTHEQAAHQLGCPIGTVRSRIARARDLLRRRLVRRGLSATAGAVAVLSASSTPAAIPLAPPPFNLVRSSVQAAMCVAAGQPTAGVVPASVSLLVQRVLWSLAMIKMTKLAAISTVTILLAFGARSWAQRPHREDRQPVRTVTEKSKASQTRRDQLVDVIEPPDLILVEVLEALPGRPISGERLVRPDGKISLGWYGDVYVAGLTRLEVKEKVVLHLRKYLNDDALGLVETDPNTGRNKVDETGKVITIDPKDSDRVFVDVTAYNSRCYYVEGEVSSPGRLPVTGSDRVLDVMHYAGGPLPSADRSKIKLIRSFPKGSPVQVLPIDYEEITMGTDSSTNYEIMPFDRIVVPRASGESMSPESSQSAPSRLMNSDIPESSQLRTYFDRKSQSRPTVRELPSRDVQHRLNEMEKKLDAILEKLGEQKKR